LRVNLQSSNIELLISEIEGSDFLSDKSGYQNASIEDKVRMKTPYIQTTLLVNELVNLEHDIVGGYIRIKEKSGKRKDR
ncbi:hypothetical protein, partial [Tritonibacter sp. SIMBA_163]